MEIETQNRSAASPDKLYEIRNIAKEQLQHASALQGTGRTKMLRRINDALEKSLNNASELVEMIRHFRRSTEQLAEQADHANAFLQQILNRVLRAMQYTFPLSKITVLKIIPPDLGSLSVPSEHLESIFFHLIYFCRHEIAEDAGIITIEANEKFRNTADDGAKRYHSLRLSFSARNRALTCRSEDIFNPFIEEKVAEDDRSGKFGVFIAKKLIEHHHGTVQVMAAPEAVVFHIEFPA